MLNLPVDGLWLHGINIVKIILTCVIGILISKAVERCKGLLIK